MVQKYAHLAPDFTVSYAENSAVSVENWLRCLYPLSGNFKEKNIPPIAPP